MANPPEPASLSTDPLTSAQIPPLPESQERSIPALAFEVRFRDLSELARGGQGRVLVAHDAVLQRGVALKELLREGGLGSSRRFEREALLTARLQHPGIVSVYDLVRRASGEPVLVMRRVQGTPLDKAIAATKTYEERLGLLPALTAACDAIAYAHGQGVIHRDIKAANVLVGDYGDTVVIDWGIAKDLGAPEAAGSAAGDAAALLVPGGAGLTVPGEVMGTPAYMSPEQARGELASVQSDVYALGSMLYELIAGRPAYEGETSQEVLVKVRSGPPAPLQALAPQVAPELSSMVSRAMAQDPAQRYASARELAEELKRFQTGRLVRSHAYSVRELLLRWARRYALTLGVAAIALLLLAVGGALGVRRILQERERANREAATASRVAGLMTSMFKVADPSVSRGSTVTARELLDQALAQLGTQLSEDPEVRARLLASIGTVYSNLGLYPQAQGPLTEARRILAQKLGPDAPETLQAALAQVVVLRRQNEFAAAEPLALDVTTRAARALGPASELTLESQSQLGIIYRKLKKPQQSAELLRAALATARRALGPEHNVTLQIMNNLANGESALGRHDEEQRLLLELIELRRKVSGPDSPDTLGAMNNLGGAYHAVGRIDDALALFRQVADADRRVLGPDHPVTLDAVGNVAAVLYEQKRYAEVEPLAREVLAGRERRMGPQKAGTLDSLNDLGALLLALHRPEEAAPYLERARAGMEALRRPDDHELASVNAHLAMLSAQRGDRQQALELLRRSFSQGLERENQLATLADPLLAPLHGDPAFESFAAAVRAKR